MSLKTLPPLLLVFLSACTTVAEPSIARSPCFFNQVWDTAVASLEGAKLVAADKSRGIVETDWIEVEDSVPAGILQRNVNKERFKYILEVQSQGESAFASVRQLREGWTPLGARMRQWRAIRPDSSEEKELASVISRRLREKGC